MSQVLSAITEPQSVRIYRFYSIAHNFYVCAGNAESNRYNEEVFKNNLKFAILSQLVSPPEGFEEVSRAHFYLKRHSLIKVWLLHLCMGSYLKLIIPSGVGDPAGAVQEQGGQEAGGRGQSWAAKAREAQCCQSCQLKWMACIET